MHWKKKQLFPVPWGSVGSAFVSELARLYRAYAERSPLECIAMKAIAILPSLYSCKDPMLSEARSSHETGGRASPSPHTHTLASDSYMYVLAGYGHRHNPTSVARLASSLSGLLNDYYYNRYLAPRLHNESGNEYNQGKKW